MKAFIFAAGKGTRLGNLTKDTPKCLLPCKGVPILRSWIEHLFSLKCDQVLFNTHHLARTVRQYIAKYYPREVLHDMIVECHEPELIGTAKTLCNARKHFKCGEIVLLVYCDVFHSLGIAPLAAWHKMTGAEMTIGVYETDEAYRCGVVELDGDRVSKITEKPDKPAGNLVWAGLAAIRWTSAIEESLLNLANHEDDIAAHWLPVVAEERELKAFGMSDIVDIGSPDRYESVK